MKVDKSKNIFIEFIHAILSIQLIYLNQMRAINRCIDNDLLVMEDFRPK